MTGIFLQVRMNSTRLPGKALLDLPDGNVIQHAMRALKSVPAGIYALLTDTSSAPLLKTFAREEGFELFTGPEKDVLKRYCLAADFYDVDTIIRATGDNPLVSGRLAREIIAVHHREQADLSHFLGIPIGSGIEVVKYAALQKAEQAAVDPYEREHLTTYLYRHKDTFKVIEQEAAAPFFLPEAKISLDTQEDYKIIQTIYRELYKGKPVETDQIIQWFKNRRKKTFVRGKYQKKENSFCS